MLPLDDSKIIRLNPSIRPSLRRGRDEFVYGGPVRRIPEGSAPNVKNRDFHIRVEVELSTGREQGVLVTQGGLSGGYALLMTDGKPTFHYNNLDIAHFDIAAPEGTPRAARSSSRALISACSEPSTISPPETLSARAARRSTSACIRAASN